MKAKQFVVLAHLPKFPECETHEDFPFSQAEWVVFANSPFAEEQAKVKAAELRKSFHSVEIRVIGEEVML